MIMPLAKALTVSQTSFGMSFWAVFISKLSHSISCKRSNNWLLHNNDIDSDASDKSFGFELGSN